MFASGQENMYLEKNSFLLPSLQPIKVEHLYGVAADKKVNKKITN